MSPPPRSWRRAAAPAFIASTTRPTRTRSTRCATSCRARPARPRRSPKARRLRPELFNRVLTRVAGTPEARLINDARPARPGAGRLQPAAISAILAWRCGATRISPRRSGAMPTSLVHRALLGELCRSRRSSAADRRAHLGDRAARRRRRARGARPLSRAPSLSGGRRDVRRPRQRGRPLRPVCHARRERRRRARADIEPAAAISIASTRRGRGFRAATRGAASGSATPCRAARRSGPARRAADLPARGCGRPAGEPLSTPPPRPVTAAAPRCAVADVDRHATKNYCAAATDEPRPPGTRRHRRAKRTWDCR